MLFESKKAKCCASNEERSYRWSDVETALTIDCDTLVEDSLAYYYPDPMSDGSSTWHSFAIEIDLQTRFVDNFTGKYFCEWLTSQADNTSIKRKLDLKPDDLYITFNYTNLLQEFYQIPAENVLHIHGSLKDERKLQKLKASKTEDIAFQQSPQLRKIQFGSLFNDPKLIRDELVRRYGRDDHFGASIEPGINNLINYCEASFKDLKSNYDVLEQFIAKQNVSHITIMGHSIMGIDNPYYEDIIVPRYRDCLWTLYYYKDDAEARMFVDTFAIPRYEIKKWPEYKEK